MSALTESGIGVTLPPGWDGEIATPPTGPNAAGPGQPRTAAIGRTVVHVANFALPGQRGDFGSGAVEMMDADDVLIVLFEHDPGDAGKALFASRGIPSSLGPSDFDPNAMQRPLHGQSGCQRFFNEGGRAFCLYVVLGSHLDRRRLLEDVNEVLASLVVGRT